jgi:hypothetical protein
MPESINAGGPPQGTQTMKLQDGWRWFHSGFARYRRNPILMMFWVMTYWTMLGLLGLVPVLGDMLVAALAPVLLIGVLSGCRALDENTPPAFTVIFSGFGARLQPLMGLGILHFLLTLGALALTAIGDGGVVLQFMVRGMLGTPDLPMPDPAQLSLTGLILALLAYVPIMLAFAYAPLLVAWRGFGLSKALFFSLVASWRAGLGLLGFLTAIVMYGVLLPSLAMMFLSAIGLDEALVTSLIVVPMIVVLAPTVVSGFYSSYIQVLATPSDGSAAPQ